MSRLKSVSTAFWSDTWVEDLTPTEKLLFLYLLTNEHNNMLGVYEISISRICFETGINKETVRNALEGFERLRKVEYKDGYIILLNYLKHQNYNTNMQKSACETYNNLPKSLKFDDLLTVRKDSEGFGILCERFGILRKKEIEIEIEIEEEIEKEDECELPTPDEFLNFAKTKEIYRPELDYSIKEKYEQWKQAGWKDGNGKKIKNWKTKLGNTLPYLKPTFTKKQNDW